MPHCRRLLLVNVLIVDRHWFDDKRAKWKIVSAAIFRSSPLTSAD